MRIDDIVTQIRVREPATAFMPVKTEWIDSAEKRSSGLPDDLKHFYLTYGYGSIRESWYRIHCLLGAEEIFDPETARGLDGVLIVGDDCAGRCEAYDAVQG